MKVVTEEAIRQNQQNNVETHNRNCYLSLCKYHVHKYNLILNKISLKKITFEKRYKYTTSSILLELQYVFLIK